MITEPEQIAPLRISLDKIEPEIWRRVEVPLDLPMKSLHDVIKAVMGWEDYHLFEFQTTASPTWTTPPLATGS